MWYVLPICLLLMFYTPSPVCHRSFVFETTCLLISNLIFFFICILYLQVSYSFYFWKKLKGDKAWKFSTVRVLVVDEGSLVSVGIFKSVLKLLCEHAKLSKLIILGKLKHRESLHIQSEWAALWMSFQASACWRWQAFFSAHSTATG